MKIRFLVILFIVFIVFSCRARKTSEAGQDLAPEETIEAPVTIHKSQITIDAVLLDVPETNLYDQVMARREDIARALQVWTRAASYPFSEDSIGIIIYGGGRFVAAGHLRIPLAYSDDGEIWKEVRNNFFKREEKFQGMAYGNGRFVAARRGDRIVYSDDGETWTHAENGGIGDYSIYGISYGAGCFVAVGFNSNPQHGVIGYSNDGETWTLVENENGIFDDIYFNCITYGKGIFIAGGTKGKVVYSRDGKKWAVIPDSPFEDLDVKIIAYGNGRYVAYCSYFQGYNSTVFYSDNGMDWTAIEDAPFGGPYNIVYGNGIFIAVSHSARMAYSIDGKEWYTGQDGEGFRIRALAGVGDNLGGIAYGNGRFVIGGGNGLSGSSKIAWCDMPEIINDTLLDVLPENDEDK
jgi:hypothetical protein